MFQQDTGVTMLKRKYVFLIFLFFFLPLISLGQSIVSFVQITDTHIGVGENLQKVLDDLHSLLRKPVFIINYGDITEFGSVKEFQAYLEIIKSHNFQFYHVIGNHDVRWSNVGKKRFEKMLGPLYQSFDYGAIHFILLDSGMLLEQYGHFSLEQLKWLEQDLNKVGKEQPIILCAHHPLFLEKQYIDNETEFLKIIDGYNIIFYLCGHGHQNKHWNINGIDCLMTQATRSSTPGYRIFEIYPDGKISVFIRDVLTKKTEMKLTRPLKRNNLTLNYALRSPLMNKKYDDNLPILLTQKVSQKVEASLDNKNWYTLQRSGSKYFENVDIRHLSEGQHTLYLKFTSHKDHNSRLEFFDFIIDRGNTQIKYKLSTEGEIQSSPILVNQTLIVGSNDGKLYCFNAEAGEKKWQFATGGPIVSTATVNQDTVFITSNDGHCYALNIGSGTEIWQQQAGQSISSSPCYAIDKVFFGSSDSCFYALKSNNGNILWKFKTDGFIKAKPAIESDKIVFGSWDGYFYCLSTIDGKLIWKRQVSENRYYSPATSNPLISNDRVFVTSHDHTVHVYNLQDGEIIWEHTKTDSQLPGYSSPITHDNYVFLGSLSGHLFALNQDNGQLFWTTILSDSLDPVFDSSPSFNYPDMVVGSIGGILYGIDMRNGNQLWSHRLSNGYIFSSPVIKDDIVYVGSTDGYLYALEILKNE